MQIPDGRDVSGAGISTTQQDWAENMLRSARGLFCRHHSGFGGGGGLPVVTAQDRGRLSESVTVGRIEERRRERPELKSKEVN